MVYHKSDIGRLQDVVLTLTNSDEPWLPPYAISWSMTEPPPVVVSKL